MLDDIRFRLRALFQRNTAEDDLDDELRFHLERAVEQHVARGFSLPEAHRRARLEFGQLDAVKGDCRQSWGIRQLDDLRQDVTLALRLIRKHPALSAVAVVSLAIGIGLNTALFALLDATLLRRLPVDRPEQLVDVYTSGVDGFPWHGSSYPDYRDLRRGARTLAGLVGYAPVLGAVRTGDRTRAVPGEAVTGDYFQVLGVPAARGRALLPDDDRPDSAPVVVISSALWSDLFDDDPPIPRPAQPSRCVCLHQDHIKQAAFRPSPRQPRKSSRARVLDVDDLDRAAGQDRCVRPLLASPWASKVEAR